jgi:hypothetical protein
LQGQATHSKSSARQEQESGRPTSVSAELHLDEQRRTPQLAVAAVVRVASTDVDGKGAAGFLEALEVLGVAFAGKLDGESTPSVKSSKCPRAVRC